MKKLKKLLCIMLIAALSVTTLTACGNGKDVKTDSTTGEETLATKDSGKSDEKVILRFSWWGDDKRHEATLEAIRIFMEKNSNITIEAEYGGFDGYQQKLSTQLAGGTEPDIIQIDQPWLSTYISQKLDFFVDLHQYEDIIDLSGLSDVFLKKYFEKFILHNSCFYLLK